MSGPVLPPNTWQAGALAVGDGTKFFASATGVKAQDASFDKLTSTDATFTGQLTTVKINATGDATFTNLKVNGTMEVEQDAKFGKLLANEVGQASDGSTVTVYYGDGSKLSGIGGKSVIYNAKTTLNKADLKENTVLAKATFDLSKADQPVIVTQVAPIVVVEAAGDAMYAATLSSFTDKEAIVNIRPIDNALTWKSDQVDVRLTLVLHELQAF
jgi:hypothetical protein